MGLTHAPRLIMPNGTWTPSSSSSDTTPKMKTFPFHFHNQRVILRFLKNMTGALQSSISGYLPQHLAPSHKTVLRPCASMDSSQRATVTERGPFKSATGAKNLSVEMYTKLDDGSYLMRMGSGGCKPFENIHEYHIMYELKHRVRRCQITSW